LCVIIVLCIIYYSIYYYYYYSDIDFTLPSCTVPIRCLTIVALRCYVTGCYALPRFVRYVYTLRLPHYTHIPVCVALPFTVALRSCLPHRCCVRLRLPRLLLLIAIGYVTVDYVYVFTTWFEFAFYVSFVRSPLRCYYFVAEPFPTHVFTIPLRYTTLRYVCIRLPAFDLNVTLLHRSRLVTLRLPRSPVALLPAVDSADFVCVALHVVLLRYGGATLIAYVCCTFALQIVVDY